MKRAVIVIVILIAAVLVYRNYGKSAPVKAYEAFAEEVLHRRYDAAAGMSVGLSAADLARRGSQERIAGPAMFQTLFPSRFKVESEKRGPDGTVTVIAVQTVLFNPPGVESALRPAMYADLRQVTTLRKTADGWKVASFENEFQKMDELTSRK